MSALADRRIEMSIEGDESRIDDLQIEIASTARVWPLRSAMRRVGKSLGFGDALIEPIEELRLSVKMMGIAGRIASLYHLYVRCLSGLDPCNLADATY
jgi:hypothetical protein